MGLKMISEWGLSISDLLLEALFLCGVGTVLQGIDWWKAVD